MRRPSLLPVRLPHRLLVVVVVVVITGSGGVAGISLSVLSRYWGTSFWLNVSCGRSVRLS